MGLLANDSSVAFCPAEDPPKGGGHHHQGPMQWTFIIAVSFLPVLHAKQHILSLNSFQSIVLSHHQPWSILLSKNPMTQDCTILSSPSQAQIHRAVQAVGDTLILNKSQSTDQTEDVVEILGYDQRSLWGTINQFCENIDYQIPEVESYAEYEIVQPLASSAHSDKTALFRRSDK